MTAEARQIVIGDVTELTSFWNDNHDLIKSRIVVQVSDYLVGEGAGVEVLEMSGGTVDGLTLNVSVLPVFEEGDHVLLFLGDSEIGLVQAFQGAYLTDGELVARMAPACGRVIEKSLGPLKDLLDEIEQALPPGTSLPEPTPYEGDFQIPPGGSRYALCGFDWTYKPNPMGENHKINPNCTDSSAGDANSQRTQIQNGTAAWNNAGAEFAFTYGGDSSQTSVSYNNTNLYFFSNNPPDGGSYVAANYIWYSGGNILENDIVFNDRDYAWWNGSGGCSGKMDIWNVATHESGHSLCLADLYGGGDSQKTMYGYVSYCETKKRTLHQDDINGIVGIYGEACDVTFTSQPAPLQVVCVGDMAWLNVAVENAYMMTFQWRRGTTPLVDDGVHIFGATTDTLYIVDITTAHAASDYNCLVTNTLEQCSVASDDAEIIVDTDLPVITQQPQDQTVTAGDFVFFSVTVENSFFMDYQWRKDTVLLSDDGHFFGTTTDTLVIPSVEEGDEGEYDCVVTSQLGAQCSTTSDAATLTVNPGGDDCPEDLDGDGQVGLADLAILLASYGQPGGPEEGDLDGDGLVDLSDLAQLLAVYGQSCPTR